MHNEHSSLSQLAHNDQLLLYRVWLKQTKRDERYWREARMNASKVKQPTTPLDELSVKLPL